MMKKSANGITIHADGAHFNGILLDNGTEYEIKNSEFYAYGDGGDDLAGWGASIMADNKSKLEIKDSYIETAGAIRCGLYVDNTSVADVKDTVIYTKETLDTYEEFANLVPAMMKRVPFALGMEGTVRSLNVMADGQGIFKDSIIVSTGWGAISCDSGTAYDICGTYCLDCENVLSGIGVLEIAQEGKEYTAVKEVNGKKIRIYRMRFRVCYLCGLRRTQQIQTCRILFTGLHPDHGLRAQRFYLRRFLSLRRAYGFYDTAVCRGYIRTDWYDGRYHRRIASD